MNPDERIAQINQTLEALRSGWPFFAAVMQERVGELTASLIAENNEQTRGRLKELRQLMELPDTLTQERDGITAALAG